jgi:hypothetical protein
MAAESWVLDGVPLTSGTFTLMELSADPPRERQDWITAADSESAALFRQPKHENRVITMKLRVAAQVSMDTALDQVAALVTKLRAASASAAGVGLVWTNSTRTRTFTVLSGEITEMPIALSGEGYSWLLQRPVVTVEMKCNPYWLGTETLTSSTSTSTPFVTLEVAGVTGDVPALGRLIITDTATQSRRFVEWGLEGPLTYNSGTSLIVDSDSMVTSGFSGSQTSTTDAYDPNASGNNSILGGAYLQAAALCGTGNQTHVGSFRVRGRIMSALANSAMFRLSWQAGDGPFTPNPWVVPRTTFNWEEHDLGTITVPTGSGRWTGRVEVALNPANLGPLGTGVYLDYLTLVPVSDGYGKARASYSYSSGVIAAYDQFSSTTAGVALNARAAPAGGTWATSGDATDFVFADNFNATTADGVESIARSTSAAETSGRFAILGATNYTDTQVDVRARIGAVTIGKEQYAIARWVDSSNYLRLVVPLSGDVKLETVVAGTVATLAQSFGWTRALQTSYRLRLIAYASGRVIGQVLSDAGAVLVDLNAASSALATAGALATGKPGLCDRSTSAIGGARNFTEFIVSTPVAEPITLYSGRNMQIRYDTVYRQDSTGTYTGAPPSYRGSRFTLPVGTSRVLALARRNDLETNNSANVTDSTQIQVGWTPRGLAVPR